jgi:PAS domain S-box-containing protein
MVISTGLDGTIKTFNRAAEQMTGYTAAEVVGKQRPRFSRCGRNGSVPEGVER